MHEFSLAAEVIEIAQREALQNKAVSIQKITIEVGDLSGVEADAFQSALELLSKDSMLENSQVNILRTPGKGRCNACSKEFDMNHRMATCPVCNCFPSEIKGGDAFRIVSLEVE